MYNLIGAIVFKPSNYALRGNPVGKIRGRRGALEVIFEIIGGFRGEATVGLGLLPKRILVQ